MDLKKIASDLVGRLEQTGNNYNEVANKNATKNEECIFAEELNKSTQTPEDPSAMWGFEKTTKAPTKAQANNSSNGETIVINVNNEINWYININISVDLSRELKDLINQLIENQNQNFEALMKFLQEEGAKNTDIILAAIKELFNAFEASNDKDFSELMEVLNKLVAQLEEQGIQIENLNKMVADLVNKSIELLEMMDIDLEAIKKAIEESNAKQDEQIAMLALINEAILQLTNKFDSHSETQVKQINELLNMVGKNGVTLDQILEILKAIKADTSEGCEIGKEILASLQANGIEITTQLANIFNKLVENSENNDAFKKELLEILKAIKDDTGKIKETNLKILDAIGNLDASMVEQATKLYNAILSIQKGGVDEGLLKEFLEVLNAIKNNTDEIKETNKQILDAIGNLDKSMVEQATKIYNAILKQGDNVDVKLDNFLKLLEEIKNNTSENNELSKSILSAIEKLNFDFTKEITNVIEAINANQNSNDVEVKVDLSGLEAMLAKILAEVQNNTKVDEAGFKAILEKLAEMGNCAGEVDLSTIEQLLAEIKNLTGENGKKLDNVINNQETMIMMLENFKKDLLGRVDELINAGKITQEKLDTIIEKLDDLISKANNNECKCDVDQDALMKMLEAILKAIEDGSCQCDCNHGESPVEDENNEGIITDLDKIFNSRRYDNTTGIDNVSADSNRPNGRIVVDGQNVYIDHNKRKVDLSGRDLK